MLKSRELRRERELLDQEAGSGAGPEPQRLLCCSSAVPEWGLWGSCPGCCGSRRLLTFCGQPFNCGQEGKAARNKTVFKSKQEKVLCFACPPDVVTV